MAIFLNETFSQYYYSMGRLWNYFCSLLSTLWPQSLTILHNNNVYNPLGVWRKIDKNLNDANPYVSGDKQIRVALMMKEKRAIKTGLESLKLKCGQRGITLDFIFHPNQTFSNYDLLLHLVKDEEDYARVDQFMKNQTNVALLNPMKNVEKIENRITLTAFLNEALSPINDIALQPRYVKLMKQDNCFNFQVLKDHKIDFPVIIKGLSQTEHNMGIALNENGLLSWTEFPCIVQTFIDHGATLWKIYVIGNYYQIMKRPSIKIIKYSKEDLILFNTRNVTKPDSGHWLSQTDEIQRESINTTTFDKIVNQIHSSLGLSLYNFDIIVEKRNGEDERNPMHYVLDINAFPTYRFLSGAHEKLINEIRKKMECN